MGFGKNDFALVVLYIVALLGLFAFQLWSVSAAIIGAILVILAISIIDKAWVEKRLTNVQSNMEGRHRELSEKIGQQMLFLSGEIESTKSTINKGLFQIEARLGRVGDLDVKYQNLVEKLIEIENKLSTVRHAVEPAPPSPAPAPPEEDDGLPF